MFINSGLLFVVVVDGLLDACFKKKKARLTIFLGRFLFHWVANFPFAQSTHWWFWKLEKLVFVVVMLLFCTFSNNIQTAIIYDNAQDFLAKHFYFCSCFLTTFFSFIDNKHTWGAGIYVKLILSNKTITIVSKKEFDLLARRMTEIFSQKPKNKFDLLGM